MSNVTPEMAAGYDAVADASLKPVEADSLSILHAMAAEFKAAEAAVAAADEALKAAKVTFVELQTRRIPDWLEEHGMTKFEHKDASGTKTVVTVTDATVASIPAASREAAFEWFESIGKGAIIAHCLEVDIGHVGKEVVEALETAIKTVRPGTEVLVSKSINANTLNAQVRGMLAAGDVVMPDKSILSVTRLRKANVKIG